MFAVDGTARACDKGMAVVTHRYIRVGYREPFNFTIIVHRKIRFDGRHFLVQHLIVHLLGMIVVVLLDRCVVSESRHQKETAKCVEPTGTFLLEKGNGHTLPIDDVPPPILEAHSNTAPNKGTGPWNLSLLSATTDTPHQRRISRVNYHPRSMWLRK